MTSDQKNVYELLLFITDLLFHSLSALGFKWKWLKPHKCCRFFQTIHGDAIMRYRNSWDEQFRKRIRCYTRKELLDPVGIKTYVEIYAAECFGNKPDCLQPKGFFLFSAFLVDLAVFCCRYKEPDLVETLIFSIANVYKCYLAKLQSEEFWRAFQSTVEEQTLVAGRSTGRNYHEAS